MLEVGVGPWPDGRGFWASNMAPAMLVLVVPPWPAARGLLRNWWEQLQRKLQHNRLGLPLHPWGPALAVQGPAICTEPANDTNGSKAISSLLDSVFWMAAPKNRRSIEVNRCRRRNPQKLIKVKARAPWRSCSHNAVACQDLSSDSNCICNLEHSSRQYQILNPPSKARDHTGILIDTSQVSNPLCEHRAGMPQPCLDFYLWESLFVLGVYCL
uniref:Uncharacterized protein n=2 Tax=Sus scrofa TaxID=9823 RepID=A0A4X1UFG3_PIG